MRKSKLSVPERNRRLLKGLARENGTIDNAELTDQLRVAIQRAEEANRIKSDFLAEMSHEIRTPMNGVLGLAHLLRDSNLDKQQREYVDGIIAASDSMLMIMNDIIDVAKIESGYMTLQQECIILEDLICDVIALYGPRANQKHLDIDCAIDPTLSPRWIGDPTRMKQIFGNLINNALKFTDTGFIRVRILPRGDGADGFLCRVEDTGIGIAKAAQGKIFEKFCQAEETIFRQFGGAGLGLNIVSHLVYMMGGDIWVESEPGKGTTFAFTLTLQTALSARDLSSTKTNKEPNGKRRDYRHLRVLIAEDIEMNMMIIDHILCKHHCRPDKAANGQAALDMVMSNNPYDIIFMDYQMPIMDGLEATAKIREFEQTIARDPVVIVAVTAAAMVDDRKKCLDGGMTDYINKPYREHDIMRVLDEWCPSASPIVRQEPCKD